MAGAKRPLNFYFSIIQNFSLIIKWFDNFLSKKESELFPTFKIVICAIYTKGLNCVRFSVIIDI